MEVDNMKKQLNITLGESTIQGLKEESEKLDMSISAIVTMLFQNYKKEQATLELINNNSLMQIVEEVIKKGVKQDIK